MNQEVIALSYPLRPPLSSDFAGLSVQPAAPLLSVVDIDEIILILLGTDNCHETIVVRAD